MLPKVAQKVATTLFIWKWTISKWPNKSQNILATFVRKFVAQELLNIAQSGHTVHDPSW